MTILLDPSRDGCTVWFLERNTVKFINGNAEDICKRIHKFSTHSYIDNKGRKITEQYTDIILDDKGVGIAYRHCLEKGYDLKLEFIKPERELII